MEATLNGPFGLVTLSTEPLTIGRAPDNTLVLNDTKASTRHAEIRPENNGYTLTDLGSTNGTFVNDQQLRPNEPRQLSTGDTIRIGNIQFTYTANDAPSMSKTIYAEQGANPGYDPTIAVPPPANTAYGAGQSYAQNPPPPAQPAYDQAPMYPPPAPNYQQPNAPYMPPPVAPPYGYPPAVAPKRSNRGLFITLGVVLGGLILLCLIASAIVYATRSTPEKTLNTYCNALKSGDYQTAYNQLSQNVQEQESEAQFASAFTSTNIMITSCSINNARDDGTIGTGSMSYTTNTSFSGIDDFRLIQENGTWKINNETSRR